MKYLIKKPAGNTLEQTKAVSGILASLISVDSFVLGGQRICPKSCFSSSSNRCTQANMKLIFNLVFFFLIALECYSQNDTLYLMSESIVLNGQTYNQRGADGLKYGNWIEYYIDNLKTDIKLILASGDGFHDHSEIHTLYRSLRAGEYNGIRMPIEESVDTIDGVLYYGGTYNEIHNNIPKEHYYIECVGKYESGQKQGIWDYYYRTGQLKKQINYKNDIPISGFQIFYRTGNLKMEYIIKNDSIGEVRKYKENGKLFEIDIMRTEKLKALY